MLLFAAGTATADQPKLKARVNRKKLYAGESVILSVEISGSERPPAPDLSGIPGVTVQSLGSQSRSQFGLSIINGRIQRTGFQGREYTYRITPTRTGTFRVGPIQVRMRGRALRDDGPTITVLGIEEQDDVLIEVTASQEAVLVDEPFDVTLSVAVRRLEGDYARVDPLHADKPPHLQIPYLVPDALPGLEGPDVQKLLQQMLLRKQRGPAFRINNYAVRKDPLEDPFNMDLRRLQEDARFRLDRRPMEQEREQYLAYAITLRYVPKEQGAYTFGPVVFKGSKISAVGEGGRPQLKDVFTVGPACTVRVVPPPEEGRPSSYVGAIGSNVVAEALLDTQTCRAGDPLQLTVRILGDMRIENLIAPNLGEQATLTRRFKIYEDTIQAVRKPGRVDFTCTVRPIEPGTYEVPPIEVAYFDVGRRQYARTSTKPIPIRVNTAAEMQEPIVIGSPAGEAPDASGKRDLLVVAPLDVSSAGLLTAAPATVRWLWALPGPLVWLMVLLGAAGRHAVRTRRSGSGRRRALAISLRMLREADAQATTGNRAAHAELCSAVRQYLSNRYTVSGSAMTPPEVLALLQRNNVQGKLAATLHEIFERHFHAGYGVEQASLDDVPTDCRNAESILRRIDAKRA